MALRNQPYLPLYVQDFMTDEKLMECSATATGVYIRLLCLLHKQEIYGTLEMKAKYKQNESKTKNFASMLSRFMPFTESEIEQGLRELLTEGVLYIEDDILFQKRMKKDGELSDKRALAGAKGGKNMKNSHTKKLYNEPGFIYLFADVENKNVFKVGISKDPNRRLLEVSRKMGRKIENVFVVPCDDMGIVEDNVLNTFDDDRDGEWIHGVKKETIIAEIQKQNQKQNVSKSKANSEYENEDENKDDIDNNLSYKDTLLKNENWKKTIATEFKISVVEVESKLEIFYNHLLTDFKIHPSMNDFAKHFKSWYRVNKEKNGKSNNNSEKSNSSKGYKPASVDREKLLRELTTDAENGNIPGDYSSRRTGN